MTTARHKRTSGPWRQGKTLRTRTTERWTIAEFAENDARERRVVFANFTDLDEGRSRVRVAVCERPEDAAFISFAPDMVAALQAAEQFIQNGIELGFIRLPESQDDPAHKTLPAIQTVLQAIAGAE